MAVVVVNTTHEARRSHYDVGIGYGDSIDEAVSHMLEAMKSELPPCSGCALGFDRLVMLATGATDIRDVRLG